jgi:hypothetical protein
MGESQEPGGMRVGNMSFTGGIQNLGGTNTNTQNNYYQLAPREQVGAQLATVREHHPDPALADREIVVIEQALDHPSDDGRRRIEKSLERLADNTGNARTVLEAVAAIGAIVAAHWPL